MRKHKQRCRMKRFLSVVLTLRHTASQSVSVGSKPACYLNIRGYCYINNTKQMWKLMATVLTYCLVVLSFDFVKDTDTKGTHICDQNPFKSYGIFKMSNFFNNIQKWCWSVLLRSTQIKVILTLLFYKGEARTWISASSVMKPSFRHKATGVSLLRSAELQRNCESMWLWIITTERLDTNPQPCTATKTKSPMQIYTAV